MGLGACDLPISISSVYMPTVPGIYDFRLLTYRETTGDGLIKTHINETESTTDNPTPLE